MTFLLNPSQIHALENRLLNQRELPGAVWGPPGTGKTTTASFEATDAIMIHKERVLITAYQNSTVDMTLRYIIQLLKTRFEMKDDDITKIVKRTGIQNKVSPDIQRYHTFNHHDLSQAKIVGVTLHSSYVPTGHQILDPNSFDRILMDESGQVTPEQAWIPFRLIKNNCNSTITAYGDDIQLTPISPDFIPDWSVLRYLRNKNANTVNMLNITQRLNWPSVKMTSSIFYNNNLSAPDEVRDRKLNIEDSPTGEFRKAILPENTLAYIGVKGNEKEDGLSFDNYEQAKIIYDICKELLRVRVRAENISVIASYRPHVKTITSILEGSGIHCSTVHRMLGGENDVIIFATTRSNYMRDLGFTRAELLNVATSRHLRKLIIVGDANNTFAEGCNISSKIYDFISTHGTMIIA